MYKQTLEKSCTILKVYFYKESSFETPKNLNCTPLTRALRLLQFVDQPINNFTISQQDIGIDTFSSGISMNLTNYYILNIKLITYAWITYPLEFNPWYEEDSTTQKIG